MPIYVYECEGCENQFEFTQSIHDPPKTTCEACGGKLSKIIVPIAFHLKGGGWYKDLYSSSKGGGGESKTETKSESKSEPKSEPKSEGSASKPSGGGTGGSGDASS